MKICVHIGYPKTATTWLQKHLFPAVPHAAFCGVKEGLRITGPHDHAFDPSSIRAYFMQQIPEGSQTLILSSEAIIGQLMTGALDTERNARRLHAIFPEAHILITTRNAETFFLSLYQQMIKEGGSLQLSQMLDATRPVHFDLHCLDTNRLVALYEGLFGPQSVTVACFEDLKQAPERFHTCLASFLERPVTEIPLPLHIKENESLPPNGIRLLARLNALVASPHNPRPLLPFLTFRETRRFVQRFVGPLLKRLGLQGDFRSEKAEITKLLGRS